MTTYKFVHNYIELIPNNMPKLLIEFYPYAIRSRCFITFHFTNNIVYFAFCNWGGRVIHCGLRSQ